MAAEAIYARLLAVPAIDFSAVAAGDKRELRAAGGRLRPEHVSCPQPVIGWAMRGGERRRALLVLEECWTEPLGAISPASLAAEGFHELADFRVYWRARYGTFRPLDTVVCYRVRPFQDEDLAGLWLDIFDRLFGEVAWTAASP
jgi:hypothetical protein